MRALRQLIEHLDIPIAHSLMAKGALPDEHPLLLGMPGFWGTESDQRVHPRRRRGARHRPPASPRPTPAPGTAAYTWRFPPTRLIQIDIDPAEIGRNYPVEIGVVADANQAVQAIAEAVLAAAARAGVPAAAARATSAPRARRCSPAARERGRSDQFPLRPERILADVRAALPSDAILVTDVGWNKNGVAQCYQLPAGRPVHHPRRRVDHGLRPGRRGGRADRRSPNARSSR